jgi:hypothetical protein
MSLQEMSFVTHILENDPSLKTVPEILKAITIKDAVYWRSHAW